MRKLDQRKLLGAVVSCSAVFALLVACSSSDDSSTTNNNGGAGGTSSTAGKGGTASAGTSSAGKGGSANAGSANGGSANAGSANGGSANAGADTGGSANAGADTGGSDTGGGGSANAGSSNGGSAGSSGSAGQAGTGGSAGSAGSGGSSAGAGDEAGAAGQSGGFTPIPITLLNPGFESGYGGIPTGPNTGNPIQDWLSQPSGVGAAMYIDYNGGTPHTGYGRLAMYSASAYVASAWQEVTGLTNGTYTLAAWFDGSATGVTKLHFIYATAYTGAASGVDPATMSTGSEITPNGSFSTYEQHSVENIAVTNGKLIIGLHAEANAGIAMSMDDVTLVRVQ